MVSGNASCYGLGFYGQKTTSGQVLKDETMTAAQSSLPMDIDVKVPPFESNQRVTVS